MKRVRFIYNPYSGENAIINELDNIIKIYQEYNHTIIPYRIERGRDISEALDCIDNSYAHILIAGGDGTVDSVLNAMMKKGVNIPIAILPVGTANDFGKFIDMPQVVKEACNRILTSIPQNIDIGKINDKYFINIFSCGLFTDVSQKTPTKYKNTFGKLAYYFTGLKELPNFKKLNLSIKSEDNNFVGSSIIFFVFNGRTAGGFEIAHDSLVDDGLLDVIIVDGENILEKITFLSQFILRKNLEYPKGIIHFKTDKLEIDIENNYSTDIDGEPGPTAPLKITCEKKALKILGY